MSPLSEPQFGFVKYMDAGLLSHNSLAQAHCYIWKCTFPSEETFLLLKKKKKEYICSI